MKKLLAVGLVLALSGCGGDTPDTKTTTTTVASVSQLSDAEIEQRKIKAESDRILAEAQAEYVANHEAELIPVDLPQDHVKTESQAMSFAECKSLQSKTMLDVLPNKAFIIINSPTLSTVKICTNDGAVLMSCSALDELMTTTQTDNTAGCD